MYVIMAYDVGVERVAKALKVGRRYLTWVQNSLFEGELTRAQLERLKAELRKVIDEEEDGVVFYILRRVQYMDREVLGQVEGPERLL